MINYLKLSAYFFLGVGVLFSLGIFALKIFFYDNHNDSLIILGPDNADVIVKPSDPKGLKVPNLDVEILNNKKALIENEKLRPLPVKPELLPIEVIESNKTKNNILTKIEPKIKPIKIDKTKQKPGLYRVQFGSFKNLDKARIAIKSMNKQHRILLSNVTLEIYTFKNTKNFLFHRVWTSPLIKKDGLDLCEKFKLKNIVCILQPNK
jgi:cell division septation protein DedD